VSTPVLTRIALVGAALIAVVGGGAASYSAAASLPNTITVRAGDTLWGIATANGLTVAQLASANGMAPGDLLMIGRHLVVPTSGAGSGAGTSGAGSSGAGSSGAGFAGAGSSGSAGEASFCSGTRFYQGPAGVLPALLQGEPGVMALRPVMVKWADAYGVAPALVEAVAWQESGWQQGVTSGADAVGVGQLLPVTADFVNNDLLGTSLSIATTDDNIRMMSAFLAYLIRQVGNDPCMVAAAYYQGPAAVTSYGVFPETQQYVRDVIALEARFG
jgi:LysM repeat protein